MSRIRKILNSPSLSCSFICPLLPTIVNIDNFKNLNIKYAVIYSHYACKELDSYVMF